MERVVFLHVPKTGGSSLTAALGKKFASWEVFPWHHTGLDLFNAPELMPFRLFQGHFNITDLDYVPKPAKVVSLIREPRKRIQSLYNYWRSYKKEAFPKYEPHHPSLTRTVGFRSFLALPNPTLRVAIDNALLQHYLPYPLRGRNNAFIADRETIIGDALQALDDMAAFGVLEQFDDSLKVIGAALGTQLILPAAKVRGFETLGSDERHELFEREEINPEIEDRLNSLTELDREFYGRAVKLFESKFAQDIQPEPVRQNTASNGAGAGRKAALTWGDWINFGAEFHLDGVDMTGWSSQEDWGIWSIAQAASLRIGPLPSPGGPIRLTVAARPAVFSAHPEQIIHVLLGETRVETWEFALDASGERPIKVLNLPSSAVDEDGYLNLTFQVQRPVSLFTAGISSDPRELGLGLESIHLEWYNDGHSVMDERVTGAGATSQTTNGSANSSIIVPGQRFGTAALE